MKVDDIGAILGLKDLTYLGDGNFGTAYISDDEKVLKITSDKNEFCVMTRLFLNQQERLMNGVSEDDVYEQSIKIYGTWLAPNGEMLILMEYLDVDGVEDGFNAIGDPEGYGFMEYFDMDEDDLVEQGITDEKDINFIFSISSLLFEFQRAGIATDDLDVSPYNIGLNKYGNYVLFDQRQKNRSEQSVENCFNDMLSKGLIKYLRPIEIKKPLKIKTAP